MPNTNAMTDKGAGLDPVPVPSEIVPKRERTPPDLKLAKENMAWATSTVLNASGFGFYGYILQGMPTRFTTGLPTAGVAFDPRTKQFNLYVNPYFWNESLDKLQRVAVLIHEMLHVTHKHVYYNLKGHQEKDRLNIAMDMVINQQILHMPKEAIFVENFKDKTGKLFPKNQTVEVYYDLLENDAQVFQRSQNGQGEGEGKDKQETSGQGIPGDVEHNGQRGKWKRLGDLKKELGWDQHEWGLDSQDNQSLKEKLEGLQDLFKRAEHKASFDHSIDKNAFEDFLKEIKSRIQKLDARGILLNALRKSMPSKFVKKSWWRESSRYGDDAPGSLRAPMPKIAVLVDTSGSMSIEEINEFFAVTNQFMTVGIDKAFLGLFHTDMYYDTIVKKNFQLAKTNIRDKVQGGGTELTTAFEWAKKKNPDMIIVLTDGYWSMPNINVKKLPECCFVISKQGTTDHPMKGSGRTVKYDP